MTLLEVRRESVIESALESTASTSLYTLAIWGSAGAGKTTLAINLAFELAATSARVLLVDLDSKRPSIASYLGLTTAGPGITAVTRLARQGRLTMSELSRLSAELRFGKHTLDVLTGMNAPHRWNELDTESLDQLLAVARSNYDYLILDLNDELEEGLVTARGSMERNAVTRWALGVANRAVSVFASDAVGVNRFLFDIVDCGFEVWPIANRVSAKTLGRSPERKLRELLHQHSRLEVRQLLPTDTIACESAMAAAKPLLLEAKSSKLTAAIHMLAMDIADDKRES